MKKSSESALDALNAWYLEQTEAGLEEDVKHYWRQTRQGPHGDCDCHWMYVQGLKQAIARLRAFRRGVYWA